MIFVMSREVVRIRRDHVEFLDGNALVFELPMTSLIT
jgi:hypothetical protein